MALKTQKKNHFKTHNQFETKNLTWLKFGFLCNFKVKKTPIQNT